MVCVYCRLFNLPYEFLVGMGVGLEGVDSFATTKNAMITTLLWLKKTLKIFNKLY